MSDLAIGSLAALWLGILTSISPCPLATNVAAVSYLSKRITRVQAVFGASLMYILGRMSAYAVIGFMIAQSIVGVPAVSQFLQQYMNKILGPLLIVIGAVLLGLIKIPIKGVTVDENRQEKIAKLEVDNNFAQTSDLISQFMHNVVSLVNLIQGLQAKTKQSIAEFKSKIEKSVSDLGMIKIPQDSYRLTTKNNFSSHL